MTAPSITVEHVDPATLLVDHNVRSDVALDKDFLASIRDLGVLVPIVAVRTSDGALRVRYGTRRTLASVEVGRSSVPVVVVGDEDADEIARIVAQWHENEHRAGLGTKDKLAAVEQLSLLGLSAGQIVKRTKARKADVEQALAASRSELAKGAAQRYEFLTLDQAAAVAEFETDPATVKALVASAHKSDGEFRHVLQRARDNREEAAQVAALTDQLASDGVRVIERPDYGDRTVKAVTDLVDEHAKPLTISAHASCPGHAAYIATTFRGVEATHVCSDWKAHGHRDRYHSGARPASGPMDQKAKAERREVISRNKEWKSASAVRRDFVTQLLTRKTPPRGSASYVAVELALGSHPIRRALERAHQLAASLLGVDDTYARQAITNQASTAADARAQVITLGLVLGAIEESTDVHTWREPSELIARYFAFLAANGYALSEVEQIAAGTHKAHRRRGTRTEQPVSTAPAASSGPAEAA